jgi:uncharacterized paraquat-inducible protein A
MAATVDTDRPTPPQRDAVMRCVDCGFTLRSTALLHNRALVLAAVCPRCDGTLVAVGATPDPSIYLG